MHIRERERGLLSEVFLSRLFAEESTKVHTALFEESGDLHAALLVRYQQEDYKNIRGYFAKAMSQMRSG